MNQVTYRGHNPDHDHAAVVTIEWHDIKMAFKVTENKVNPLTGNRTIKYIPFEDSIHPYGLAFDPPLIERAVGDNNGFAHHWEKLNYAFALPNPAKFPKLKTLADDDREVLRRYVYVCRQLAGYSALNDDSALTVRHAGGRNRCVLVRPASDVALRVRRSHVRADAGRSSLLVVPADELAGQPPVSRSSLAGLSANCSGLPNNNG